MFNPSGVIDEVGLSEPNWSKKVSKHYKEGIYSTQAKNSPFPMKSTSM
jgi:hypothetical protein